MYAPDRMNPPTGTAGRRGSGFAPSSSDWAALLLAAALLVAPVPSAAQSDTIVVTTTSDISGSCPGSQCSLRAAIGAINTTNASTVRIPAGTYTLTEGELGIVGRATIIGAGADSTILDGSGKQRIFVVDTMAGGAGSVVRIQGVTMRNGHASGNGGAVLQDRRGTLTITESVLSGNSAALGGAVYSTGSLVLLRSTATGNSATAGGGGAVHTMGAQSASAQLRATNATFSGNSSTLRGSAIYTGSNSTAYLANVTVSENSDSAAVASAGTGVYLANSILMNAGGPVCSITLFGDDASWGSGLFVSQGHNLLGDITCTFALPRTRDATADTTNIVNASGRLGPLGRNGGPTPTVPLQAGSPAIDAGDPNTCASTTTYAVAGVDQRGIPRPQGARCDIGAFEAGNPASARLGPMAPREPVAGQTFSISMKLVDAAGRGTPANLPLLAQISCASADASRLMPRSQTLATGDTVVTFTGVIASQPGAYGCRGQIGGWTVMDTLTIESGRLGVAAPTGSVAGEPFHVVVRTRNAGGVPFDMAVGLPVTLSTAGGGGTLGGTLTGVVPVGRDSVVISGVTYSQAAGSVVITATASGNLLAAGSVTIMVQNVALEVGAPTPGSPVVTQEFSVPVRLVGASTRMPVTLSRPVSVALAKASGSSASGVLSGPTITIAAGSSSIVIPLLSYSAPDTALTLRATGNGVSSGEGRPFAVVTSFVVTSMTDDDGNGTCPGPRCSVRSAINAANTVLGSTVEIPSGTYTLAYGALSISSDMTIVGSGADGANASVVSGNAANKLQSTPKAFDIAPGPTVTIRNLAIEKTNNVSSTGSTRFGGAISNAGTLTVENTRFSGNGADYGGAIYNSGNLTVRNSSFDSNYSQGFGGAIYNRGGTLTVYGSTFSGNSGQWGGGIATNGTTTIANSTFSGNTATANGGGVYNASNGTTRVFNSTFSGNGGNPGGAVFTYGQVSFTNSVITASGGGDCSTGSSGAVHSGGNNVVSDASCGFTATGDQQSTDPKLGALADNGGSTQTMLPQTGSPVLGAGNAAVCAAAPVGGQDQRGVPRPASACSVGAVEGSTGGS
jgi:CSLREA domain-containing protein